MSRLHRSWIAALSVPLLLAVAACTSAGSVSLAPSSGGGASLAPSSGGNLPDDDYGRASGATPPAVASGASGSLVLATGTGAAGTYLTGPNGLTLYIFTEDSENRSVCAGDCATAWPPLIAGSGQAVSAGDGVSGALSTFARDDGSLQVAYDGKPLYYFAADKAPGDTTGEGFNDVWFIAKP